MKLIVAPFAGAWIETPVLYSTNTTYRVAPFAGAWIETHSTSALGACG